MESRLSKSLLIAGFLFACNPVQASIAPTCDSLERCSRPLEDVTIVTPGEFLVAKLHCYGCPTVEWTGSGSSRRHRITHEENALLYNISISNSTSELLLNDVTIFPLPSTIGHTEQPPHIYVPQVSANFSVSSLLSTIECTHKPCQNYNGKCFCIPDSAALGSMGVDYEYIFSPKFPEDATEVIPEDRKKWTLSFDALGGYNGYVDDPRAAFESTEQQLLSMELEQDEHGVLSILGAHLATRKHLPEPAPQKTFWESVRHFFGVQEEVKEGHVIFRQTEWDMYGRTGTLKNHLKEIWYGWPWGLIFIIIGSVVGGLTLLYAIYRFYTFVDGEARSGHSKWAAEGRNETWSRKRGYYLEEDHDEREAGALLAADSDIEDESDSEPLLVDQLLRQQKP